MWQSSCTRPLSKVYVIQVPIPTAEAPAPSILPTLASPSASTPGGGATQKDIFGSILNKISNEPNPLNNVIIGRKLLL
jgi:hypothetical protein